MTAHNPRDIVEYQTDHDLLIELRTEMRGVREDIKDMKDNTSQRLNSLEMEVESLKLWRSALIGAWGLCTLILIPLAFAYFT